MFPSALSGTKERKTTCKLREKSGGCAVKRVGKAMQGRWGGGCEQSKKLSALGEDLIGQIQCFTWDEVDRS